MAEFQLNDNDFCAIEIAKNIVKQFLSDSTLSASQIIILGRALLYLEKLPEQTPYTFIEYGISYRNGDEDYEERRFISFGLYDDYIEIISGGSVYDKRIGSDTFLTQSYRIELSGCIDNELTLYDLEELISEYLSLGAEIKVFEEL